MYLSSRQLLMVAKTDTYFTQVTSIVKTRKFVFIMSAELCSDIESVEGEGVINYHETYTLLLYGSSTTKWRMYINVINVYCLMYLCALYQYIKYQHHSAQRNKHYVEQDYGYNIQKLTVSITELPGTLKMDCNLTYIKLEHCQALSHTNL